MHPIKTVTVCDRLSNEILEFLLRRRPDLSVTTVDPATLATGVISPADCFIGSHLPSSVCPEQFRWVHSTGAGVDGFLFKREWPRNVILTRTVGNMGRRIAEFCAARIAYIAQDIPGRLASQRARSWNRTDDSVISLEGSKATILGTGAIGCEVARLLTRIGIVCNGVSRSGQATPPFSRVETRDAAVQLMRESTWIVNTLPLTTSTIGFVDRHLLAECSKALIINVGRGATICTDALLEALDNKTLRGAALDVFEEEPLPLDSPLWSHDSVLISPHVAALTKPEEVERAFFDVLEHSGDQGISGEVSHVSRGY